jgi:hypothetical protein
MRKKAISKATVMIVLLFILLGAFFSKTILIGSQQVIKAETKAELAPGEVRVTKNVAPVDGMVNQWDVTVDLEAKNHFPPPSQDIFIALDVSGSMLGIVPSTGKTRLEMLKETAKTFVTEVLQDGYDNRVGILLFGREVNDIISYKTPAERNELLAYIDNISVKTGDGTNIQLALRNTAEEMNSPSNARLTGINGGEVTRSMILLSDGVPTDSALPSDENWMIPYSNNKVNMSLFGVSTNGNLQYETIDTIDGFDYEKIVPYQGSSGGYRFRMMDSFGFVAPPMTTDNITPEAKALYPELVNNEVYRYFNHSNSTISESKLVKNMAFSKDASVKLLDEIYTIGIDLSLTSSSDDIVQVAQKTLKEVATNGNNYNADTDEVEGILKEISEKMIYTAQQSSYSEKILDGFAIEGTLTDTNVSQGSITYNSATNEIFWDAGTLATPIAGNKDHMKASLTYRVSANNDVLKAGMITNEYANISGKSTAVGRNYMFEYLDITQQKQGVDTTFGSVKPIIVHLEKKLFDAYNTPITTSDERFNISYEDEALALGDINYTQSDQFQIKADGNLISVVHPWKNNTDYTVSEQLSSSQKYDVEIKVNDQVKSVFNFGTNPANYNHQQIVVNNTAMLLNGYLNIRQVVLSPQEELVVPEKAFYQARYIDDNELYLTSESSTKNTPAEINQSIFDQYAIHLTNQHAQVLLRGTIPEYYEFSGYILTSDKDSISDKHVSSNQADLTSDKQIAIDYSVTSEYWLTMFIKPKFGTGETAPRAYSWDYAVNLFGK